MALLQEAEKLIEVFEINFAGRIRTKRQGSKGAGRERCVVSFPGKYMDQWTELAQSKSRAGSIACVFFPRGSINFGKHVVLPGNKHGQCHCHKLCEYKHTYIRSAVARSTHSGSDFSDCNDSPVS